VVKWVRRRPAAAALLALVVGTAVLGTAAGLWFTARLQDALQAKTAALAEAGRHACNAAQLLQTLQAPLSCARPRLKPPTIDNKPTPMELLVIPVRGAPPIASAPAPKADVQGTLPTFVEIQATGWRQISLPRRKMARPARRDGGAAPVQRRPQGQRQDAPQDERGPQAPGHAAAGCGESLGGVGGRAAARAVG
jgi:hypothetical protein